jgi:hypothetical protein
MYNGFRRSVGIVTLVLAGHLVLAEQAAPPASGVVSGALTSPDGQPVRKAQVRLLNAAARSARTTTSDENGRFVFTDVPAGEYTLSASKPGFLEMVFGARRPGPSVPGTPIRLAAGQKMANLRIELRRGSVLTGTMRFIYENGRRALGAGGNATTDDRGVYRIAGLMPGEYLVSAVPRDTVAASAASAEALRDRQAQVMAAAKAAGTAPSSLPGATPPPSLGYAPIYHPGTPARAAATPVRVGAGEEVGGIDIRLQVIQTASISGTVSSSETPIPQTRLHASN